MSTKLAGWLSEQMREAGLGRNELARRSGVSPATLTRILRHGHVPRPEALNALADVFGAARDTVLELAGLVELSDLPGDLPPELKDLARRLYRLHPADRRAILRQFDGILRLVEGRPLPGDDPEPRLSR